MSYASYIAALLFAALVLFLIFRPKSPGTPPLDFSAAVSYWQDRIASVGGENAYKELAAFVSPMDASVQHDLAHAFGEALFREDGAAGISVCDSRFSYGCYHQLVGDAIAASGLPAINSINAECLKLSFSGPCQHGIGHGLVGYLGYTQSALQKAIAECTALKTAGATLQGCYGGAFMEYNMRTLASSSTRPLSSDRFSPCDSYTGEAQASCYLYQPQWWWTAFSEKGESKGGVLQEMGDLCATRSGIAREACYEGIGEMVPQAESYGSTATLSLCDEAGGTESDKVYCAIGAAVVFEGTGSTDKALEVCNALPFSQADCLAYAQGQKVL